MHNLHDRQQLVFIFILDGIKIACWMRLPVWIFAIFFHSYEDGERFKYHEDVQETGKKLRAYKHVYIGPIPFRIVGSN